jgi:hypothetical protein
VTPPGSGRRGQVELGPALDDDEEQLVRGRVVVPAVLAVEHRDAQAARARVGVDPAQDDVAVRVSDRPVHRVAVEPQERRVADRHASLEDAAQPRRAPLTDR